MSRNDEVEGLKRRIANLERAFELIANLEKQESPSVHDVLSELSEVSDRVETWATHQEMQQLATLEVLSAITSDISNSGSAVTQLLPVTVFLDTRSPNQVVTVAKAIRALLSDLSYDVFFEGSGEWGSWFGRIYARSKHAFTSEQAKDALVRAERALEMQALLLPQAQIDATQAGAAANLIAALSNTPNAIVQIGSVLVIKVEGTPIVRNLTQTELSYLEHNRQLYKSPKAALDELARLSDDPSRFTLPRPMLSSDQDAIPGAPL